jgi:putative transposase
MPRQPRYPLAGIPQHVIQRGNNRQTTFYANGDYHFYLNCLREAADRHDCHIHAYVLMTNHVHLLMTPQQPGAIAKVMQSVGRRYVQYVNYLYQRSGTLWEGRYKASLGGSERYLLTCYRYIELDPVRASMVTDPADYRWYSYRAHALGRGDSLIVDHAGYQALGESITVRCAAYRSLFEHAIGKDMLSTIRSSLNECRVLGDERFKDQVETA